MSFKIECTKSIYIHPGLVDLKARSELLNQAPLTVWLTGLSGAGKSSLAYNLEKELISKGRACYVLDGDNIRYSLNKDLSFTLPDRSENIRRVAEVARLFNDAGLIVITAFISPMKEDRLQARTIIGNKSFYEVHVSTSLDECERRDPKNLYKKARSGQLASFTGISSPYEIPDNPDLVIDTQYNSIEASVLLLTKEVLRICSIVKDHDK